MEHAPHWDADRMTATIVLVHSPLLGPISWRWVADELVELGHRVVVPSIVAGASSGSWEACVERVVAQEIPGDDQSILVGHSGAGQLLPSIAATITPPPKRLVFVDAALPPEHGQTALVPEKFAEHLRRLARGGVLPPWSEWFGSDVIAALIPDEQRRHEFVADMPEVPLSYFDARITLPEGWSAAANGAYILLSDIYRPDADEAMSRGWPVVEMIGGHMDPVARPTDVATAIHALAVE